MNCRTFLTLQPDRLGPIVASAAQDADLSELHRGFRPITFGIADPLAFRAPGIGTRLVGISRPVEADGLSAVEGVDDMATDVGRFLYTVRSRP